MMGQPGSIRQPPEKRKKIVQEVKAERQIAMMQLRAEAASARALGLSLLAAEYGHKAAALRQQFGGNDLAARLSSLMAEQRAAEQALVTKLANDAQQRRAAVAKEYNKRSRGDRLADSFKDAAAEAAHRGTRPGRPRQRDRARGTSLPRPKR